MVDAEQQKTFRTLRGYLDGTEPDEPNYFRFSATLRVHGDGVPLDEITQKLGVAPSSVHRKGDRPGPRPPAYSDDAWHYESPLAATESLERHIDAIWHVVQPHLEYLKLLKKRFTVDVFCGYQSNCDTAGFEVSYRSLELFTALEVPFGVSIIVA
jgi:Domain of unknown function (DUF4279)